MTLLQHQGAQGFKFQRNLGVIVRLGFEFEQSSGAKNEISPKKKLGACGAQFWPRLTKRQIDTSTLVRPPKRASVTR